MKERLITSAEERFGRRPDAVVDLVADGSTRQYFRLVWDAERPVIGAIGPDRDENRAFPSFARAFCGVNLPVPEIYAEDQEAGVWLEEDLSDTSAREALMEAMILAAGLGRRLAPLTDSVPKALFAVRGRPLLAHVMDRLAGAGATRLIVNTSRHSDQINRYLEEHAPPGVEILVSREPDGPYDTGGGFLAAAHLFRREGPILLHAVDVLSFIPLEVLLARRRVARERVGSQVVATLAVQTRTSSRRLLFGDEGLMGWEHRGEGGSRRSTASRGGGGQGALLAHWRDCDWLGRSGTTGLQAAAQPRRATSIWLLVGAARTLHAARRLAVLPRIAVHVIVGAPQPFATAPPDKARCCSGRRPATGAGYRCPQSRAAERVVTPYSVSEPIGTSSAGSTLE